jgi:dihydroflavonol-4-reductase
MNILVTGATGFIGSHLCQALVKRGHHVRALHRPTSSLALLEGVPLELVQGDLFEPDSLSLAARDTDVVYHCGGRVGSWTDAEEMAASHVEGTHNILSAARQCGVRRFIHTSSVAALGVPERATESNETLPIMDESHAWNYSAGEWPYGYAKHRAEEEVRRSTADGFNTIILNPASVFGAGDKNLASSAIVMHMARGRRPPIPPGGLNVIHIDDVVAGHIGALEHGVSGERYILGGENITFEQLLTTVAEVVGAPLPRWHMPSWALRLISGPAELLGRMMGIPLRGHMFRLAGLHFYYNCGKAQRELFVPAPRTHLSAIEDAYTWYLDNGFLD